MLTENFQTLINQEIDIIIANRKAAQDPKMLQGDKSNHRGYAFLIWCLELYKEQKNFVHNDSITDGNQDASCDIIFNKTNYSGEEIFYIVQCKSSPNTKNLTDEILKSLNDFDAILNGYPRAKNHKTEPKLKEINAHQRKNGQIKFFFICACKYEGTAEQNIKTFHEQHKKAKFTIIDIEQLRLDYIETKFKNSNPLTPFETYENPAESPIKLEIESKNGIVILDKPFKSYVLLVRPKTIWQLFKKYEFLLFQKNVRNPLLGSTFNEEIKQTAIENPDYFWYYNNGITGITNLLENVGTGAEIINLEGLQIINGAQTVYSIYWAYENANKSQRNIINAKAYISFRLLESGGKDFDLKVTRYTNSQNPILDRDFFANDDIQIELQKASFQTNFWYEKRRGEFKTEQIPEGVTIVTNEEFANVYLAYHLQEPILASNNIQQTLAENKNLNFISYKDHPKGAYEKIFNKNTSFTDILSAYKVNKLILKTISEYRKEPLKLSDEIAFSILSSFLKIILVKYFKTKYKELVPENQLSTKVIELCDREPTTIKNMMAFLGRFFKTTFQELELINLFKKPHIYQQFCDELEMQNITAAYIDSIELSETEQKNEEK